MKSLFLWAIGMLGLIGLSVYETVFSPSFMMQFVTAGLILCALSELLWFGRLRILWLRDVLFLIGMGLAFAAVVMYVTGDDRMTLDVLGGAALSALLLCLWIYRTRKRGTGLDVLAYAAAWAGFLVCSFTILCGFTNTFLFFYGATLLLLQGIRLFHDLKSADRHTASDGIKRNLVQAIILAGVLVLIVAEFHNPFTSKPVAWFIRTFGRGPEILYENEGKNMTEEDTAFLPGAGWLDTDGNSIQAHGGQIVRMPVPDGNEKKERYVWTGENKTNGHLGNSVAVYVSDDLHQWEYKGDVLRTIESREALDEDPYFSELYRNCSEAEKDNIYACINTNAVLERPKMLYNEATETYVIWFHSDDATEKNSYKYDVGMAGVAVSDSPFGPFRFLRRQRLSECPKGQIDCFTTSKGEARDMNLFQDTDGTAYIVYTSENNKTLYISKLDETYTSLSAPTETAVYGQDYIRLFPSAMREAPVLFRGENGRYYLLSSSTTGWMSNQGRLWSSDAIFGTWKNDGTPFSGQGSNISFDTQCTSVFQREDGQWIYYGDRWKQDNLADSRYIWLPLTFDGDTVQIEWKDSWA